MVHSLVKLPLSAAAFAEIKTKLQLAGYEHTGAFMVDGNLDLTGIAVTPMDDEGRAWEMRLGYVTPRCPACGNIHLGTCTAMDERKLTMDIFFCNTPDRPLCSTPDQCSTHGCRKLSK